MTDEPKRPLTAAEKACYHIYRRVQECPDFAWLMVGTESLDLVCAAVAEHRGETHADVKRRVEEKAASGRISVEVVDLRRQVEELESQVASLKIDAYDQGPRRKAAKATRDQVTAIEEVLRLAEIGLDVLTVDVLRDAIRGNRMAAYRLPPASMEVG